jgi:hypothetical protein
VAGIVVLLHLAVTGLWQVGYKIKSKKTIGIGFWDTVAGQNVKAENSEMISVSNDMAPNTSLPFNFDSGYTAAQTSQLQYVKIMVRWA